MVSNLSFFNGCFDKGRLKSLISWSLINCGEQFTIELVENLKNVGFEYATQAGVSLSLDDLKIPPSKARLVSEAEFQIISAQIEYKRGHVTAVEKFQQLIDTWHRTSETLKQNVIQHFRATDILNPVYMMAFSGARGNVSQVRQLVGMRGLMADPQGQIIDFPIRSNFREGLTLTEYVISCYGARKGLVDTALRTANSGYLTRRLVDVSQHVIVCQFDCGTQRGILLSDMTEGQKVLLSLQNRLIGRVLAEDIYTDFKSTNDTILAKQSITSLKQNSNTKQDFSLSLTNKKNVLTNNPALPKSAYPSLPQSNLIANKDQEISSILAEKIAKLRTQVLVRSPLTCEAKSSICQLCYGWSLAHGNLVSLGEAVGILAAQSIGEPGTQLTMRTFHTGGVFSGDLMTEMRAPFDGVINFTEFLQGVLIRTPHGKIAFLTKTQGDFCITSAKKPQQLQNDSSQTPISNLKLIDDLTKKKWEQSSFSKDNFMKKEASSLKHKFQIPASTILFVRQKEFVLEKQLIAEFSSISTQTNQRIQAKHNLNSELEGQVFFENVLLGVKLGKEGDIIRIAKKLGSIWILSGKIYQTMVPTSFFPKPGDLVDSSSVINQILVISPYTGFLDKNSRKKLFGLLKPTFSSVKSGESIDNISENPLSVTQPYSPRQTVDDNLSTNVSQRPNLTLASGKKFVPNLILNTNSVRRIKSFMELKKRYDNLQNVPLVSTLRKTQTSGLLQNSGNSFPRKNLSLSCTLLSFSVKTVSYYQLGYFITFWNNKELSLDLTKTLDQKAKFCSSDENLSLHSLTLRPGVPQELGFYRWSHFDSKQNWEFKQDWVKSEGSISKPDLFFLSTSLKQELSNSEDLKKLLYLQSFPKNYKTQTGGLLFYDSLYLNDNGGQIFWIPEESYKLDPRTFFIPTHTGFTLLSLFELSQANLKNFLQKSSKKWINNNFPILSKYNSQGKIINFSSKMSGWLQLKPNNNLSAYTKIANKPLKLEAFSVKTTKRLVPNFFNKELVNSFSKCAFWEVYRLKTLFSTQFSNFKNIVTLPIKTTSFRRNPYILVNQRYLKNYKIVPYKKNYLNQFSKLEKTSKNQTNFKKLAWFFEFGKYKCNEAFLNKENNASLRPKAPFINSPFSFTPKSFTLTTFPGRDEKSGSGFASQVKQIYDSNNFLNQQVSQVNANHKFFRKAQLPKIEPFISNDKSSNANSFEIGIKSGWVYFPHNKTDSFNYHKQIIRPGFSFTDNIGFDQQITYVECIPIPLFLSNNYKCYFSAFQVKEKNLSLGLKLNSQKLIKEFPVPLLKKNSHSFSNVCVEHKPGFSPPGKILLNDKTQVLYQKRNGKNLNIFLFKLQKCLFLNQLILKKKSITLHTFTPGEIDLVKQGIPDCIKLGSDITFVSDKIYYIKNKNHRHSDLLHNKDVHFNNSPRRRTLHQRTTTERVSLANDNYLRDAKNLNLKLLKNNKIGQTYPVLKIEKDSLLKKSSSFYLAKSYLKFKNLRTSKNRSITQITFFDINSFIFQSVLPKQLVSNIFSLKVEKLERNLFTPSFCILIRKVKQYSIFKPKYYKKSVSGNNQRGIVSNPLNYIGILTNITWFNKQVKTKLFSSFPSADLQINPSFRFKNSKQMFVTKQLNIFEFFILLNIPKIFPFKTAKVDLNLKQILLPLNLTKVGSLIKTKVPLLKSISSQKQRAGKPQNLIKDTGFFLNNSSPQTRQLGNLVRYYSSKQKRVLTNSTQDLTLKEKVNRNYKNKFLRYLEVVYKTNRLEFIVFRNIDNSSFMVPALKNKTTQFTNTKVVLHSQNYIFANNPLSLTDFFSPYHGEITDIKSDSLGKQSCFFLTEKDQLSFSTDKKIPFTFVGKLMRYGEQIAKNLSIPNSGQIIQVDKSKVILRKAQPILFSSKGIFYVHHGDFVEKNSPLLTLFYQRLKTGDIVQGIPKIEQLFEARQTKEGEILPENLHDKLHTFFEKYKQKYSPQDAARKSLEKTQQLLVDGVQRVYQSQGVTIADKHLEVIVRQMTSKVKIIEGGQSGLLRGELIDLDWIEIVNKGINSQKAEYEPVILGITKAALETESFISAASFQETTRILARAAIERKTDFLRGLKENVILGHLIPAGTGFSLSFNPQSSDYSTRTENVKFFKNLCLGLKKNDI